MHLDNLLDHVNGSFRIVVSADHVPNTVDENNISCDWYAYIGMYTHII